MLLSSSFNNVRIIGGGLESWRGIELRIVLTLSGATWQE
jgi:hypothetical protein